LIIVHEAALHRHLKLFLEYYHQSRTHWSLEKDTPESRSVEPPESGPVVAVPQRRQPRLPYLIRALVARVFMNFGGPQAHERQVGGLHHRYERRAA
jgi:hypothetical protein